MKPYYQDNSVKIYHGDCREILNTAYLPQLPRINTVCTDPPYSQRTHEGARTGNIKINKKLIDFEPITKEALHSVFYWCGEILKGWLISTIDWRYMSYFNENPPKNLDFIRFGIWDKPNGTPQFTGDRPAMGWEAILIMHTKGKKKWNGGGSRAVWRHNKISGLHPTAKPQSLIITLLNLFSNENETILDPFMGSGTTLRIAKDLGRKAIGIEIEEKYCEIAARRMGQESLFNQEQLK